MPPQGWDYSVCCQALLLLQLLLLLLLLFFLLFFLFFLFLMGSGNRTWGLKQFGKQFVDRITISLAFMCYPKSCWKGKSVFKYNTLSRNNLEPRGDLQEDRAWAQASRSVLSQVCSGCQPSPRVLLSHFQPPQDVFPFVDR